MNKLDTELDVEEQGVDTYIKDKWSDPTENFILGQVFEEDTENWYYNFMDLIDGEVVHNDSICNITR